MLTTNFNMAYFLSIADRLRDAVGDELVNELENLLTLAECEDQDFADQFAILAEACKERIARELARRQFPWLVPDEATIFQHKLEDIFNSQC